MLDNPTIYSEPKMISNNDHLTSPNHYAKFKIQPIEFIQANNLNFAQGNALKYLMRAGSKLYPGMNPKESALVDLEKAKRNIEFEINRWANAS
jgi:hypothetical protein